MLTCQYSINPFEVPGKIIKNTNIIIANCVTLYYNTIKFSYKTQRLEMSPW